MKNLSKSLSCLLVLALFISMFSSCKKDGTIDDLTTTPEPTEETNNTPTNDAASTLMALGRGGGIETDSMDLCNCFDLFDNVDWDASEAEIEAQVTAILASLTETQLEELFLPVCTPDGEIYINACVADCNGATNYSVCDLDDFCDDLDDYCDEEYEDCFSIAYPLSILLPDGTTQTANSDEELETIFDNWEMNNPTSTEEPQVVYPFNVTTDSTTLTINNDDELEELLASCYDFDIDIDDEYDLDECFEFVYPLTIVFPDASAATVNNDEELWTAVENWYDANPTNDEDPTLQYPVDVVQDSTTITINNDDELEDLFEDCYDHEIDDCFTLVYPLSITLPDGTTATANNDDELETIIENWYNANPNSNEDPTFVFPLQVEMEDGTLVTVNNEDELDDLFEDCYGDMGGCFVTSDSSNALSKGAAKMKVEATKGN